MMIDPPGAPSTELLRELLDRVGVTLSPEEGPALGTWVGRTLASFTGAAVGQEPDGGEVEGSSRSFRWATREEDPLGAFISMCDVPPTGSGAFEGTRVAVKDCIAVAGIPLTEGGGRRPYPVPSRDATVVERLLGAGARVVGKTNMEDMAVGTGIGSHFGPTRNPHDPSRISGGSSGGSAVAVASGMAEIGLGTDQAGSVRIPASWCGVVGMKPSHGLVATQGIARMDPTLDHVGPLTTDVLRNAAVLDVLCPPDQRPPAGLRSPHAKPYAQGDPVDPATLHLGVLVEALDPSLVSPDVRAAFDLAVDGLEARGASTDLVSVPLWPSARATFNCIVSVGLLGTWLGAGMGFGTEDVPDPSMTAFGQGRGRVSSSALHPRVVTRLAAGQLLRPADLAAARARRTLLRRQVDAALDGYDALIMPTVPTVAYRLEALSAGDRGALMVGDGRELANTCPFDLTGHPALSVPCGRGEGGLPVGVQVVGPMFGEHAVYQVGLAFEASSTYSNAPGGTA